MGGFFYCVRDTKCSTMCIRMRKNLFYALLLILCTPCITWGDTIDCKIEDESTCMKTTGCFYSDDTCDNCSNIQFYTDNTDNGKDWPRTEEGVESGFKLDWPSNEWPEVGSEQDCRWEANCNAGYYLTKAKDSMRLSCEPCDNNTVAPQYTYRGTFGAPEDALTIKCLACPENSTANVDTCLCDSGYNSAKDNDPYNKSDILAAEFTNNGKKFEIYECEKNRYTAVYYDYEDNELVPNENATKDTFLTEDDFNNKPCEDGNTLTRWQDGQKNTYEPGTEMPKDMKEDITVTAICEYQTPYFDVRFDDVGDANDCEEQTCSTEEDSCDISCSPSPNAPKYFIGWKCDKCDENWQRNNSCTNNSEIIKPEAINNMKGAATAGKEIVLTAQYVTCPQISPNNYGEIDTAACATSSSCFAPAGEYKDENGNTFVVPTTVNDQEFTCYVETGEN